METNQQEFTKTITSAQRILVIPASQELDEQLASAALAVALRELGKKTFLAEAASLPTWQEMDWLSLDWEHAKTQDFVITIKTENERINELRYEKSEEPGLIKILIHPNGKSISEKDVVFAHIDHGFDLIILSGAHDQDQLAPFKEKYFPLFVKANVISFGYRPLSQEVASQHFLITEANSLPEAVFCLLTDLAPDRRLITPIAANLILAGFLQTTENFQNQRTTPTILKQVAELLTLGAKTQQANELLNGSRQIRASNPFQELLKKARLNEKQTFRWLTLEEQEAASFLPEEDFIELTAQLATLEPKVPHNLLLASSTSGNPQPVIKGWLKSSSVTILSELSELLNGFMFNGVLTFPIRALDLEEAERKILKMAERIFDR